jgi:hypothetical protein
MRGDAGIATGKYNHAVVVVTCRGALVFWTPPRPPCLASETGRSGAQAPGGGEDGLCIIYEYIYMNMNVCLVVHCARCCASAFGGRNACAPIGR